MARLLTSKTKGLNGSRGLLAAVFAVAVEDAGYQGNDETALHHKKTAVSFFGSQQYRHLIVSLGFPPETMPKILQTVAGGAGD